MSDKQIAEHWLGMTGEDKEHLEEDVDDFKRDVLAAIMGKAKAGDLDAVSWLEEREYLYLGPADGDAHQL